MRTFLNYIPSNTFVLDTHMKIEKKIIEVGHRWKSKTQKEIELKKNKRKIK